MSDYHLQQPKFDPGDDSHLLDLCDGCGEQSTPEALVMLCPECAKGNRRRCKSVAEIRAKLEEIESDVRLQYKPANIHINAPLALMQTYLETMSKCLRWVLNEQMRGKDQE